ncbi:MAG TPA: flagellar biosynthetic protein FliR [Bryobacteraceae bacterium]|jgi:flagellar biosynthetic protein FliR
MATELTGPEFTLDAGTLYAFLLVLARVSGIFIFVPLPGIKAGPEVARAVLSLGLTLALVSRWPVVDAAAVNVMLMAGWILAEAAMGIAVGLAVAFLAEGFQMGAQIISLQAGYTFATTIDPTSGADSEVLLTIAQLAAGLLFFAAGLDRQIMLAVAHSLSSQAPGHLEISPSMVNLVIQAGSSIFATGFRLVLPLLSLLLMVEISMALMARLNAQLHLMLLSRPIKMLLALQLFAWLLLIFPRVFEQSAGQAIQLVRNLLAL